SDYQSRASTTTNHRVHPLVAVVITVTKNVSALESRPCCLLADDWRLAFGVWRSRICYKSFIKQLNATISGRNTLTRRTQRSETNKQRICNDLVAHSEAAAVVRQLK
ncbi:unnamed protein product, partial [Ceratitis capitata]